ncbi:hypothetical protein CYMTET_11511 [Cymbomonas tetramitiformis]|uniref:Uncharacterized protein n=1 Tax=Cymbomonas tetramitiformis TaxID=36881 RepID=A0AAE0GMC2_9CHLO|nr:hypothetical protein CYMTET_11511 [Cymbomonas tetramitiformis]
MGKRKTKAANKEATTNNEAREGNSTYVGTNTRSHWVNIFENVPSFTLSPFSKASKKKSNNDEGPTLSNNDEGTTQHYGYQLVPPSVTEHETIIENLKE